MTEPFDEYGERLRRVLHAEAEAVVPSPEGLEKIRAKIDKKAERRFTGWLSAPWLRPLAAVAAAVCVAVVAVSATPALKTFVQTGRFSSDTGHEGGSNRVDGRYTGGQASPPGAARSGVADSPHPSSATPTSPDTHVVTGHKCPPGEGPISPSHATRTTPGPTPRLTCRSEPTARTSPTKVATTPPTSPPAQLPPSVQPTNGVQPSAQSSP